MNRERENLKKRSNRAPRNPITIITISDALVLLRIRHGCKELVN